jgi:hypothetical protein
LKTLNSASTTDFTEFEEATCTEEHGCKRRVGAPSQFTDSPLPAFQAAAIGCNDTSEGEWIDLGTPLYAYGAEILPNSIYDVYITTDGGTFALVGTVTTGKLGDAVPPFGGESQPNFLDIDAIVGKFRDLGSAPSNVYARTQPNVLNRDAYTNFLDISVAVEELRNIPYHFVGPCPCPPLVTCGPGTCATNGCTAYGGRCNVDTGYCEDDCGRCLP